MNGKMIARQLLKVAKQIVAEDETKRYYINDILWDIDEDLFQTDYDLDDSGYQKIVRRYGLPDSIYLDVHPENAESEIQDYLEDEFGCCVKSFEYEEV